MPLGAGVLGVDSEALPSGEDVTPGSVFDVADDAGLGSGSALMSATGAKAARLLDDNLRVTRRDLAFFGRGMLPDDGEALTVGAILMDCRW